MSDIYLNSLIYSNRTDFRLLLFSTLGIFTCISDLYQSREEKEPAPGYSYRELKSIANGNYYYANRVMRFSMTNHYTAYALRYTITDLKNNSKEIKQLPKILVQPGHNQVDIDLDESELEDGGEYLLRVYPFNEQAVQVRFIYRNSKEEVKP